MWIVSSEREGLQLLLGREAAPPHVRGGGHSAREAVTVGSICLCLWNSGRAGRKRGQAVNEGCFGWLFQM